MFLFVDPDGASFGIFSFKLFIFQPLVLCAEMAHRLLHSFEVFIERFIDLPWRSLFLHGLK